MLNIPQLEAQIQASMAAAFVPGLAIAVIHDNEVIYQRGFGITSVEDPHPVTPETLFRVGSITKPLTATMIMRLVEQKRVDLDAALNLSLLELLDHKIHISAGLTLRMLLSHTGNIRNDLTYYESSTASDITANSSKISAFQYSNQGINLAALAALAGTNIPYPAAMQAELFTPLGMNRTTFDPLTAMTYPLALPHLLSDDEQLYVMRPFIDNPAMYPCGFAMSNVVELANFARMHLNDGHFNGKQFLSPETIHEMHHPQVDRMTADNTRYGLCFRSYEYRGVRLVGHNGAIGKYGGWLWLCPTQKTAVIMLVNRAPQFWGYAAKIVNNIFDALLIFPDKVESGTDWIRRAVSLQAEWLRQYIGNYLGAETGLVQLTVEENQLHVRLNREEKIALFPLRENVFASTDKSISVGFINDSMMYCNGTLCEKFDDEPFAGDILPQLVGIYQHDMDTFTVRVANNTLYVYSMDDRTEYAMLPISRLRFVGDNGLIEFVQTPHIGTMLLWQQAFDFRWIKT